MTPAPRSIRILIVDDEPERLSGILHSIADAAIVITRTPLEVSDEDLRDVDLVSVDEYLGEEWAMAVQSGADLGPVSLKNLDGLAVAASFRSQTRQSVRTTGLNFAVTLHTAELGKLAQGLPVQSREALTASQHDLDWVFTFDERLGTRLIDMAHAVRSASEAANSLSSDFGSSWLGLPSAPWADTAREQIEDCRPPAHALAVNTRGRSYLRWLAQRVLPFPTFLVGEAHSAHLLGITIESFRTLETWVQGTDLLVRYEGPLEEFAGRRWWRAGWQQILVDAGANQWDPSDFRAERLGELINAELTPLRNDQPVITYDIDGNLLSIDVKAEDAVRLQADGWPIYADDPWGLIEDVIEDPDLVRLVAQLDRHRLPAAS